LCSSGSPGGGSYGVASSRGLARAISASFDGGDMGAGIGVDGDAVLTVWSLEFGEPQADRQPVNTMATVTRLVTRRFYSRGDGRT
jgi:hypothetical protein